jgi:hypothetical protein
MRRRTMAALCAALCFAAVGPASSPPEDLAARLGHARGLHCTYTSAVTTWVRQGHRTVDQTHEKVSAVYDNINVDKGTARLIGNAGASDLVVWLDRSGSLWMLERTPGGNEVVTTVVPMYAEDTTEFIVLESRHSFTGPIVTGETDYGTCKVWD